MNKKSIVLFFSVLVLLGLGVYYVAGQLSSLTVTQYTSDSTLGVTNGWITNRSQTINITLTTASNGINNISNLTFTLPESNISWMGVVPGNGLPINLSTHPDPDGLLGVNNLTYDINGNGWNLWVCINLTDSTTEAEDKGKINCYFDGGDEWLGSNTNYTLILTLNATAVTGLAELEGQGNITVELTNESAGSENMTSVLIGVDTMEPRLIEMNISDGNTTYANNTWGAQYRLRTGLWTIQALVEDATLESYAHFVYNCNNSNSTWSNPTGWEGGTGTSLVGITTASDTSLSLSGGTKRGWISTTVDCTTGLDAQTVNMSNATLTFGFLVNDSFNHYKMLNDSTSDTGDTARPNVGLFWMTYDDGDVLPIIAKVNVTTNASITFSDNVNGKRPTLDSTTTTSGLDYTNDYMKLGTIRFDIEVTGGDRPPTVFIVWNTSLVSTDKDTASLGPAIIGDTNTPYFSTKTFVEEGRALNATNPDGATNLDSTSDQRDDGAGYISTVIYSAEETLSAGNASTDFVFFVYANNTGNNYTTIAGPYKFRIDGTGPTMTMTPPADTTITPRASITYSCKAADAESSAYMIKWELVKPQSMGTKTTNFASLTDSAQSITFSGDDTMYAGDYSLRCKGVDNVGNEQWSSASSFSVHYSTTGTSAGEGGSTGGAADIDLSTTEETTITEKQGTISTFTLDGTTVHKITIKTIDEVLGKVLVVIESDPIEVWLSIGETKEVDVDADGTNDISVTLNKITDGVADITTKRLTPLPTEVPTEEVPPTEKPTEVTPTAPEAASKTWLWILIIVVIVVIGVGYWFMKKK